MNPSTSLPPQVASCKNKNTRVLNHLAARQYVLSAKGTGPGNNSIITQVARGLKAA